MTKKVLVVDDEEAICTFISFVLKHEGYACDICRNGNDAIEKFHKQKYDLVIMDIMMPGKDGIETIIEMRQLHPPVPIIAISGADSHKALLRIAHIFKADASLKKPFTRDELIESINKALFSKAE